MQRLFESLFYDIEHKEYIELQLRHHDKQRSAIYLARDITHALELVGKHNVPDTHVWFGVAPRFQSSNNVRRLTAIWMDVDAKDHDGSLSVALRKATETVPFNPSCLVMTGGGYHAYWFLDETTNPMAARKALERLRDVAGADHTIDVTRLLRVPGTLNPKYNPPIECQLVYINTDHRYSLTDIIASTNVETPVLKRIVTGEVGEFASRSERDWNVIRALQMAGVSYEGIKLIFETRPVGDKYQGERSKIHYLKTTVKRASESIDRQKGKQGDNGEAVEPEFEEREDGYWITGKRAKRVSTFIFLPSRLLSTDEGDVFAGKIVAGEQTWDNITLPRGAFDRVHNLLKHLTSAHWQWLGTDAQVRMLLPHVMKRFGELGGTTAQAVTSLGRHGDAWVTSEGLITTNGFIPSEIASTVFIDQKRKHHKLDYQNPGVGLKDIANAFARLFAQTNKDTVVMPLVGWLGAAMIKPLVEDAGARMPNLAVWGTRGAGKSSVIKELLKLVGVIEPAAVNCRTTPFVLLSLLASSTSIPVHLGEFRADMAEAQLKSLRTWLLMGYDSGVDARGRPDQSVVDYPLTAPLILDGEDLFEDPAVRERTIAVGMSPEVIAEGTDEWLAFMELQEYPTELLALPLVQYSLETTVDWVRETFDEMLLRTHTAFPAKLPDRVRRNVAVCLVGWQLITDFFESLDLDFPATMPGAFRESVGEIVNIKTGRTTTQVDDLVVDLVNHAADGGQGFAWKYDAMMNVLWIHLSTASAWWYGLRRRTGQPILGTAAVKRQLRERLSTSYAGVGQYIIDIKSVDMSGDTRHAYGLSLEAMVEAGLDVPESITVGQIVFNVKGG